MKRRRCQGFSLIEVVVSSAAVLVIVGALLAVLQSSVGLSQTSLRVGRIEESGQRVANSIARELRWADPDTLLITVENGSSRLDYRFATDWDGTNVQWSPTILYRYEPMAQDVNQNGIQDEGQVVRIENGRRRVIARGVPQGGLQVQQVGDQLQLSLQLFTMDQGPTPLLRTVQSAITLRN